MDAAFSLLWAVPLVGLLGYASHRAGLCTVRAVADVMKTGNFERFAGFARAVFWTLTLTVPAVWLFPGQFATPVLGGPLWTGLLGGMLFGFGAALNKGCSFSTLQRLADGDWRMLAALAGFFGGSALCYSLSSVPHLQMERVSGLVSGAWLAPATLVLWVWAAVELTRLWRHRVSWRDMAHAPSFSPAATGLVLGLGSALIPGGNDTLLLRLIPSLAPGGLWIYLMLIFGVAMGLSLQRRRANTACKQEGC